MKKKDLITVSFLFTSLVFMTAADAACDASKKNTLEIEKNELLDLNNANMDLTLYNFRSNECTLIDLSRNSFDASVFLPSDETTLGIYQAYRDSGDSQIDALKHTLAFNINEQQS